jgi:hypothetical protein
MKHQKKYIKITMLLGVVTFFLGCSSQRAENINGIVMKDKEGNLYRVELHIGELFRVEKIEVEDLF